MNRLGIIVAVAAEARSFIKGPLRSGEPILFSEGAMLLISGMGPKRATKACRALLDEGAAALLSWGSAGGLAPDLSPGSLILPKTVVAPDQSVYQVDLKWHQVLCRLLNEQIPVCVGPLVESSFVVRSPGDKTALFHQTGAIGVDMESAAVASVAHERDAPFIAVRAVADPVGTAIPLSTMAAVDAFGRMDYFRLMQELAKRPAEIFGLVRMGRDYRAALRTLERVARLTGENLSPFAK